VLVSWCWDDLTLCAIPGDILDRPTALPLWDISANRSSVVKWGSSLSLDVVELEMTFKPDSFFIIKLKFNCFETNLWSVYTIYKIAPDRRSWSSAWWDGCFWKATDWTRRSHMVKASWPMASCSFVPVFSFQLIRCWMILAIDARCLLLEFYMLSDLQVYLLG